MSYGSTNDDAFKKYCSVNVSERNDSSSESSTPERAASPDVDADKQNATERTPLLLSLPPYASFKDVERQDGDDDCDDNMSLFMTLGIEAEVIPALANTPGEHGDFRLPRETDLRYKPVAEEDEDLGSEISFKGGLSKRKFWIIFTGILITNFIAAFDSTILASTHSAITSSFGASNLASWLSTSFLLTATSFQPLFGRVSDVIGRKIPFVASCFIFSIATLWCALAQSVETLIVARAICGIGAGGMLTMSAILLSDMCTLEVRSTYQSINNLAYGLGSALGAATGGLLADVLGWRWIFGIQVPFSVIVCLVCSWTIPNSKDLGLQLEAAVEGKSRFCNFDFAGSFYLTTSVAFLILGMNLGGNVYPWTDFRVIGSLVLGLVLGNLLIRTEKRARSPIMPLQLLWTAPRGNLVFNNFFCQVTINNVLFNLPLYFQAVLLESATKAGSRLLIPSVAGTFASVATGLMITRTGRLEPSLFAGCGLSLIGGALLCFMQRSFPGWIFFLFLIPCNLGNGFALPSTLMSVLATSSQTEQAVATSTLIVWRSLGSVLGVASSSLVLQSALSFFLKKNVSGSAEEKAAVIAMVRERVTAVFDLDPIHQAQVVQSYDGALKMCFAWSAVTSVIACVLVIGIRLPKLRTSQVKEFMKEMSAE